MSRHGSIFGAALAVTAILGCAGLADSQQVHETATEHVSSSLVASTVRNDDAPLANASEQAPTSFKVGGGDVLGILVWKEKDLSPTVTVRPDGNITMPLIGEVHVAGLTPVQIEGLLQTQLKTLLLQPKVTVTVVEIHSLMVYITGEVGRPGAYPLNTQLTVLQLIAQAGGLTEFASKKHIRLLHGNSSQKATICNYGKMLHADDPTSNPVLSAGDTVIVQ
jgi:polysaccharide export outer membrane protein